MVYSLPVERILGLIIPPKSGLAEWIIYPGIALVLLVFISLITRKWRIIFLSAVFLCTLVWALGDQIPLVNFLAGLPGLSLLRVPPRVVFLGELLALISSGMTLQWLVGSAIQKDYKRIIMVMVMSSGFILFLGLGLVVAQKNFSAEMIKMLLALVLAVSAISCIIFSNKRNLGLAMLGLTIVLDLYSVDITQFTSDPQVQNYEIAAYKTISSETAKFRVYSSSYAIPQETAIREGIELAQGVNPMQLSNYVSYMEKASGIPNKYYGVVVPPLQKTSIEDESFSTESSQSNSSLLGLLNVKYIVEDHEIFGNTDIKFLSDENNLYFYQNEAVVPRAYLLVDGKVLENEVKINSYTPNVINLTVVREGSLVLSEICYPGWRARVDGKIALIECYSGIFRMIQLENGPHQIVFRYQPTWMYVGFAVSGIILLILLLTRNIQKYD